MSKAKELLAILEKDVLGLPEWVWEELGRYNDSHGKRLAKEVIPYMKPFLPTKPIVLYRGMGFDASDALAFLKKLGTEAKVGNKGNYKTGKLQSWSASEKIAQEFLGKHNIVGREKGSLGIMLKLTASPEQIAIPIGNLPAEGLKQYIRLHQDEYIMHPGSYEIEIVYVDGDWPSLKEEDIGKLLAAKAKEIAAELNAVPKKNWNKTAGFAIYRDNTEVGSIQVHLKHDLTVNLEAMGFSKQKDNLERPHKDRAELIAYIKDGLAKDVVDMYNRNNKGK